MTTMTTKKASVHHIVSTLKQQHLNDDGPDSRSTVATFVSLCRECLYEYYPCEESILYLVLRLEAAVQTQSKCLSLLHSSLALVWAPHHTRLGCHQDPSDSSDQPRNPLVLVLEPTALLPRHLLPDQAANILSCRAKLPRTNLVCHVFRASHDGLVVSVMMTLGEQMQKLVKACTSYYLPLKCTVK